MLNKDFFLKNLADINVAKNQALAAFQQNVGVAWYIENVLLPACDPEDSERAEGPIDTPPRTEQVG